MHYSYVEIEYVATSFAPARMNLALKLLKGGEWDAYYDYFSARITSCTSWCSLLQKRNGSFGQAYAHVCPSSQSILATGPRFVWLNLWLHEEDMWQKQKWSFVWWQNCRVYYRSANPAPHGEKLPIDQNDHWPREFGVKPHHGGRCIDGQSYQVGVIRIPPTNFTSNNQHTCQFLVLFGSSHMKL